MKHSQIPLLLFQPTISSKIPTYPNDRVCCEFVFMRRSWENKTGCVALCCCCCCWSRLHGFPPPGCVARVALKSRSNQMEVKCVKGGKFTLAKKRKKKRKNSQKNRQHRQREKWKEQKPYETKRKETTQCGKWKIITRRRFPDLLSSNPHTKVRVTWLDMNRRV